MKKTQLLFMCCFCGLFSISATAQDWLVGVDAINSDIDVQGFDSTTGAQVWGGMRLAEDVSLKLALGALGEYEDSNNSSLGMNVLKFSMEAEQQLSDQFGVYFDVGFVAYDNSVENAAGVEQFSESGFTYFASTGMLWYFSPQLAARIGYEQYPSVDVSESQDFKTEGFHAGLRFAF